MGLIYSLIDSKGVWGICRGIGREVDLRKWQTQMGLIYSLIDSKGVWGICRGNARARYRAPVAALRASPWAGGMGRIG